ncbi:MAG: 50S ribosomal protein L17 [Candidatus Lindowbacteria bacterium]|nr:50S ribosomal protein L17 [Candidatus Lindowbacteria bacterium]
MRHRVSSKQLDRNRSERRALLRSLARSLIKDGRIRTTVTKAKALRSFIEPLVTKAKKDTLSNRRLIASKLPDKHAVKKLFGDYGPRYSERPGGYVRVIRVSGYRRGDAAQLAEVQWV